MNVEFLIPFGPYRRGQKIDHQFPGYARELARRGILKIVDDVHDQPKEQPKKKGGKK